MVEEPFELGEKLAALRKELGRRAGGIRRAQKALDELCGSGGLQKLTVLDANLGPLADADLGPLGLEEEKAPVVAQLGILRDRLRARARARLMAELGEKTRSEGLEPSQMTERPLVVLLAPLQVELNLEKDRAILLYAREPVEELPLEAGAIVTGRRKAIERIREIAGEPGVFFDRLRAAYRLVLAARGLEDGQRVDLVDLLAPLALLRLDLLEWRKQGPAGAEPYPRYLLAYQLQRLLRDGGLARGGLRLELGTATGGSTRNKRDVLFIPTSHTEGQYHLSIRFVPLQPDAACEPRSA